MRRTTIRFAPSGAASLLAALADQSLIQRQPGIDGEYRYSMLETVREFGLERLIAHDEYLGMRDAHADWCLAFAARAGPELAGSDHVAWFNRVEAEIGNIRAAHEWLITAADADRATLLGMRLSWFWQTAGYYQEGRALFTRLMAMPEVSACPEALARILGTAGSLEHQLGNLDRARELVDRAHHIARESGDERGRRRRPAVQRRRGRLSRGG